MTIFYLILIIFLFVALLAALIISVVFLLSMIEMFFVAKVPFVPVPSVVLQKIIDSLNLNDNCTLYDLGCGDAKVLIRASTEFPHSKYVGVEMVTLPYWLARIRLSSIKDKNIKVLKKNFFTINLGEATHIYTYLLPKVMDELLPKLERELKPGARLVSCDFKFTKKDAKEVIDLGRGKKLGSHLYVYEF